MSEICIASYASPLGKMVVGSYDDALCLVSWEESMHDAELRERLEKGLKSKCVMRNSRVIEQTVAQLEAYFEQQSVAFDLELLMVGTPFQKSVWQGLLEIPYAETRSYQEQAKALGNERAVRAVALANSANPLGIIIPCHRVIGKDGALRGYAGGVEKKEKLLALEKGANNVQ